MTAPRVQTPSPALRLDAASTEEMRATMAGLVAQQVPLTIVAHAMLRLAATNIRETEGPHHLRHSIADVLYDLNRPHD